MASWFEGLGSNKTVLLYLGGLVCLSRLSPVSYPAVVLRRFVSPYRHRCHGSHMVLFAVPEGCLSLGSSGSLVVEIQDDR